ncbi:hypothetical protein H7F15_10265 [Pontibacter sp. Tf4]|uniref:hypothetical protein n=1 Tax=Pontibacter sp. Tf4 TaxID=2761620 RepID=UPI0016246EA8|nr:hypothetical protein [Pontibacter sp. Tf4]MBB6611419.1 hypothetical protein [Pontibacter sp. Tf4]
MKNTFYLALLYLCLALLLAGCSEDETPVPECLQVEVMGEDCDTGWYILKVVNEQAGTRQVNSYLGQLHSGFVTTDNLPAMYRQPGTMLKATLELNGEYGPRCVTVTVMYPAVKVTNVCTPAPVTDSV